MIEGVIVKKLRPLPDERGRVMEMMRCDDEFFESFGQVYITTAYPGVTKAWHYHKLQTDHLAAVKGMVKLALYDGREGSATRGEVNEFFMGEHNPILVRIPPGVFHGFKNIGTEECIIVNTPSRPYDHESPDECRADAHDNDIPYDWARKDR